ncbi:MAG: SDR family NAD(P)-dependent oxidoreductase [Bacilli bacterium]
MYYDVTGNLLEDEADSMTHLDHTNVLITGASSGVGRALALQVAACGGTPILLARDEAALRRVADEICERYRILSPVYACDLTKPDDVDATLAQMSEEYSVHVLVNNAGVGYFGDFDALSNEQHEQMIGLNITAAVAITKYFVPHMKARGAGHILNVASLAGMMNSPRSVVYGATKSALISFSDGIRLELAPHNVFVTTVNPGPISTPFHGKADETGMYAKSVQKWMITPEFVAERIVCAIGKPVRVITLPRALGVGAMLYQLMPRVIERWFGRFIYRK